MRGRLHARVWEKHGLVHDSITVVPKVCVAT